MIEDEVVKKHNLTPPGSGGTVRDAAVIFKLASQLTPEVRMAIFPPFTCGNILIGANVVSGSEQSHGTTSPVPKPLPSPVGKSVASR